MATMTGALFFIGFLIVQRLAELALARRNTARLLAKGAREFAPGHYPFIVAVHTLWIAAITAFGFDAPLHPFFLGFYAILQAFRLWILGSLGERWTTRIVILDEPLVERGPYRFAKHPNYILVVAEIAAAPAVLGLWWIAGLFTVLNAIVLFIRISEENKALATIGSTSATKRDL